MINGANVTFVDSNGIPVVSAESGVPVNSIDAGGGINVTLVSRYGIPVVISGDVPAGAAFDSGFDEGFD